MTPPPVPRNMLVILTAFPAASSATGVAVATPSTSKSVMDLPKLIRRKQRPASAGLMKFLPRPPKQHFATIMAKAAPMIGPYSGVDGDSESASRRPVTTAEPSFQVSGFLQILSNKNSESTAVPTDARMIQRACSPFTTTPTTAVGIKDAATTYMINCVVQRSLVCGPEERFNNLLISTLPQPLPLPRAFSP